MSSLSNMKNINKWRCKAFNPSSFLSKIYLKSWKHHHPSLSQSVSWLKTVKYDIICLILRRNNSKNVRKVLNFDLRLKYLLCKQDSEWRGILYIVMRPYVSGSHLFISRPMKSFRMHLCQFLANRGITRGFLEIYGGRLLIYHISVTQHLF